MNYLIYKSLPNYLNVIKHFHFSIKGLRDQDSWSNRCVLITWSAWGGSGLSCLKLYLREVEFGEPLGRVWLVMSKPQL